MKKAIIAGTSIATMALMAMPALAGRHSGGDCCGSRDRDKCCPSVEVINNNNSDVSTVNVEVANTGLNGVHQHGGFFSTNKANIETFDADATANTGNIVNNSGTEVDQDSGKVLVVNDSYSRVRTTNVSVANTGLNSVHQHGGVISSNEATVWTGNAKSTGNVLNVVGNSVTDVEVDD